jgi:hypothetical protein
MGRPPLFQQMQVAFMCGFTLFEVWLGVKWVRHARVTEFTKRDWFGALGFWLGFLSSSVLGYEVAYFGAIHEPFVGVSGLLYLILLGSLSAVGGLLFGLMGRSWVRPTAVFVSVVAAFEWANLVFPFTQEYVIAETMIATLVAGTLLWFAIRRWASAPR